MTGCDTSLVLRLAHVSKAVYPNASVDGALDMQVLSGSVYSVGRNDALYAQDIITANFK